ncbi:MAG: acetate--CoA ligase family protein, partial [Burkholderiaceae bacterium]|nr:acetate--CoA ligase family protein [Burkholderiaceae bacterium]
MKHLPVLSALFDPATVALVIEPEAAPAWVEALARQLREARVDSRQVVLGSGSEALPAEDAEAGRQPLDLALVAVGAARELEGLRCAAALGARAAVMLTPGATPEVRAQQASIAHEAGMQLLGPATMGFVRPTRRLNAGRMGVLPQAGNIALVSQSGALNAGVLDWAQGTGIGFSLVVSLGAEAGVDVAQVLDFVAADASTKAVVVYLEVVREARSFMSALRALSAIKPVVVLKGGREAAGWPGARTHSGVIATGDAIYGAALRRAGAVQVRLFAQLFTSVRYLATRNWPIGKRLAVISNGNGPAVLASDWAYAQHLQLLPFTDPTVRRLAEALPGVEVSNPLDLRVTADADAYVKAIEAIAYDPESDATLALLAPCTGVPADEITDRVAAMASTMVKPMFACWLGEGETRPLRARLEAAGVPVFDTPEAAVDAFSTIATFYRNQLLSQQVPRPLSEPEPPQLEAAHGIVDAACAAGREALTELESKALLEAFMVPVNRTLLARKVDEAVALAARIGYPVAMKISSAEVAHKSDVGGVVLNVRNAGEVRTQYAAILASVGAALPQARLEGVTLQAMKNARHGRELYVGVFRDRLFGPVIAFGTGGTRIEVVRDTTLELPPLNRLLAHGMIARTRVSQTLGEFRGAPPIDVEALAGILVRVSEMVCELPQIVEMDINPIIADGGGAIAVDARVVIDHNVPRRWIADAPPVGPRYAHMAIMPYPLHMVSHGALHDGRPYAIRPIQGEDGERLQRFVRGMSERSRYFRFISTQSELTPRMLARYTQIDYDRELALVATLGRAEPDAEEGDETIIGVVRYLLNPDRSSCEFAIAI